MALDSSNPIRESLREVDVDLWMIADRLFLSHQSFQSPGCTWDDGHGGFFRTVRCKQFYRWSNVTDSMQERPPASGSLRSTRPISLIYDAGDVHAVWEIGEAFLKIIIPLSPYTTREHVTLEALHNMALSFAIPDVLYHGEWNGRYYLLLSKIPGQTLSKAWPRMLETTRNQCVDRIASICKELAAKHAREISGIDGNHLPEAWLANESSTGAASPPDFSPEALLKSCRELRMDCSSLFEFVHCDMGPGNIIVDFEGDHLVVGLIDWECAGFVPREWFRTKSCICSGLDLPEGSPTEWRGRMQRRLGEDGFPEMADAWMAWRGYVWSLEITGSAGRFYLSSDTPARRD